MFALPPAAPALSPTAYRSARCIRRAPVCAAASAPPTALGSSLSTSLLQKALTSATTVETLLATVEQNVAVCDAIHVATALHRVSTFCATPAARAAVAADRRWTLLIGCMEQHAAQLDARGVSSCLWAFARLQPECPPPAAALAALRHAAAQPALWAEAAPQAVANAAWAHVRLSGSAHVEVLDTLAAAAAAHARQMKPGELAQVLHAYGSAAHKPSATWAQSLWAACAARLEGFAPRELAIVLWAYARLAHTPGGSHVRRAAEQLAMHPQGCDLQAVSLALWALATLKEVPAPAVLTALVAQAQPHLAAATSPQPLCNLLWGAALLRHDPGPDVVAAALSRALALAPALRPADVAQLTHALLLLRYAPGPRSLDALGSAMMARLGEYCTAQLVGILHALGRMGWDPDAATGQKLIARSAELGGGDGLSSALARLGLLRGGSS